MFDTLTHSNETYVTYLCVADYLSKKVKKKIEFSLTILKVIAKNRFSNDIVTYADRMVPHRGSSSWVIRQIIKARSIRNSRDIWVKNNPVWQRH